MMVDFLGLLQEFMGLTNCDRKYLWKELVGLLSYNHGALGETSTSPIFLVKIRRSWFLSCYDEFYDFIFEHGLFDLPLVGGTCMWSNNHDSPSWSIIGRFLISP